MIMHDNTDIHVIEVGGYALADEWAVPQLMAQHVEVSHIHR